MPGEVRLWDTQTGKLKQMLTGIGQSPCLTFSPDGKTLAIGSYDQTIKLWDVPTGEVQRTLRGHRAEIYSLAFSPDGRALVSASKDHTIKLCRLQRFAFAL